jgi:gliding motility-associated-like protein
MKKFLVLSFVFFSFVQEAKAQQCENPQPIATLIQTFCKIDNKTVGDIDVNGSNIVWYNEEVGGTAYNNLAKLTTGFYYADDETNNGCSTSRLKVEVFVYGDLPETFIAITECALDESRISDLFAVGENLEWFDAEFGGNQLAENSLLEDGNIYWVQQTENGCVSNRSSTHVTLLDPATVILETEQTFCLIDKPTIADIKVQLNDVNSSVLWYKTETSTVALDPTQTLVDGNSYWATQVEGVLSCESTTRAVVTVVINTTSKPTTSSNNQTFCTNDSATIADLDISGTNIKWYDTATSTTALNETDVLVIGDYYATQTDTTTGCESSERILINVAVTATSAPTTSAVFQTICEESNAFISNLEITGTNIKWYDSLTSTTVLSPTEPLIDGEDYYATQTDVTEGCESIGRTKVTVLYRPASAPTTSSNNQTFCTNDSATIADLDISGTNIKWYDTATSTTALNETDVLVIGDYYATQTDTTTGCESSERILINVAVTATSAPTTSAVFQTICEESNAFISNLEITGTNIKWYDSLTSTTVLSPTEPLIDGEDYYATQTDVTEGCESIGRTKVTVLYRPASAPTTTSSTQVFCLANSPTLNSIEIVGDNIKWYDSLTSTIVLDDTNLIEDGKRYYASQTNTTGCESDNRLEIIVELTAVEAPILSLNGELFCLLDGSFILSDLNDRINGSAENSIVWYDKYPNGNVLSLNDMLVHDKKYYAISENVNGCTSVNALEVQVNLESCLEEDLIIYDGFSPNDDGVNDVFTLENITLLYPNYIIIFYNRWGNIVYEGNSNKPYWNGKLNGNGEKSPKGIYFYVLNFNKNNIKPKQGKLYLSR